MSQSTTIDGYNQVAGNYATKFLDELKNKPLDRLLLNDFAAQASLLARRIIDFGCGPGQTTRFLHDSGLNNVLGTDISSGMIEAARVHHKGIDGLNFEVADMLNLPYPNNSFTGAIAFYSIVNFDYDQIVIAFKEISRVLQMNALFLFSFHVGEEIVHLSEFLDQPVNMTFYFLNPDRIHTLLQEAGFEVVQTVIRYPYDQIEHPSKRAYITAQKR